MKIIEWNSQGAFRKKNEKILSLNPDILIVSECESEEKLKFGKLTPKPNDFFWYGDSQNKGIGVFSYSDYKFELLKEFNPKYRYVIPLKVTRKNTSFILFATIPRCLHKIFYINQSVAYSLMFRAAGEALKICSANPKFLGAQTGAVAILHTWGQTLTYHPHIHMIVPAGGLSEDGMEWVPSGKKFFLLVKVLSGLFRGILCRYIGQAVAKNRIKLPDDIHDFDQLKNLIYAKKWVVYAKNPFAGPERVIEYLGNYTHRVAISNHRIVAEKDGKVIFRYKDYRTGKLNRYMTLDADEFITRFLKHVLPNGFYKVRYFGLLSQCNAKSKLESCFTLIETDSFLPQLEGLPAIDVFQAITGKDPLCCPKCGKGKMIPRTYGAVWPEKKKRAG